MHTVWWRRVYEQRELRWFSYTAIYASVTVNFQTCHFDDLPTLLPHRRMTRGVQGMYKDCVGWTHNHCETGKHNEPMRPNIHCKPGYRKKKNMHPDPALSLYFFVLEFISSVVLNKLYIQKHWLYLLYKKIGIINFNILNFKCCYNFEFWLNVYPFGLVFRMSIS